MRHSHQGFEDLKELPLFNPETNPSIDEYTIANTQNVNGILKTVFFEEPIDLETQYTDDTHKESKSPIRFLGVVYNKYGSQGFAIEIDHTYQIEVKHSYTRDWYNKKGKGLRDIFTEQKTVRKRQQYRIYSTWWKSEKRMHIEVFNGKQRDGNKTDFLKRDSILPAISEIVSLASEKGCI